jgi:hypothetical protein
MKPLITPDMTDAEILAVSDDILIANARQAIKNLRRAAVEMFVGIAIPEFVEVAEKDMVSDEPYICDVASRKQGFRGEKVLKFNRRALRKIAKSQRVKRQIRMNVSADDKMVNPVGKPGSEERKAAFIEQYAELAKTETSVFAD